MHSFTSSAPCPSYSPNSSSTESIEWVCDFKARMLLPSGFASHQPKIVILHNSSQIAEMQGYSAVNPLARTLNYSSPHCSLGNSITSSPPIWSPQNRTTTCCHHARAQGAYSPTALQPDPPIQFISNSSPHVKLMKWTNKCTSHMILNDMYPRWLINYIKDCDGGARLSKSNS